MIELRYGDTSCRLELPAASLLECIRPHVPPPASNSVDLIKAALDDCEPQLREFCPGDRVVIVTSDITRYTGSELYLPLLVERLHAVGIPDGNIEIIIALGIHRPQTEHEHRKIVGELYGRIQVTDHRCDDPGKLVCIGRTRNGIDVEINRHVAEADRVILTGTIGFHYFAGFGGGRKAILPGVASRRSCMASHFSVLNSGEGTGRHPLAATGILDGNPVHEAMMEACALVKPAFILNTVLAPDKSMLAVFAGDWRDAHRRGSEYYEEQFACPLSVRADMVVVSCGGFPKDINFIQAHKSMEYGSRALRDGGVMILLAQCRDGYGNATFFNWFRFRALDEFESALRQNYEINGQTAYATLQKAQRFRVILVSDLPPEEVAAMSMIPAKSLDDALDKARGVLPENYAAYVIPEGGAVLPVIKPGARRMKGYN